MRSSPDVTFWSTRATGDRQHTDLRLIGATIRGDASPQLLSEVGGLMIGSWVANPATSYTDHLVAAGLLLTGHIDSDVMLEWMRQGWSRGRKAWVPYHPPAA